jgi:PhnB protein
MPTINPYVNFLDKTEDAFNFYKSVFGGEFSSKVRFREMPSEQPMPAHVGDLIMHISLPIGKGNVLMGNDCPEGFGPPLKVGNNFSVSISTESEAEADKLFKGLSEGGKITMPIAMAPWNSYFGMLTDKFDINWMVSYDYNQQKK